MKRAVDKPGGGHELASLDAARVGGADVPTRVRLAPWGEVKSTRGTFVVDDESARLVTEAFTEQGTDLPIDYEHQTLGGPYASPTGQAPAAGWIKRISVEPGEGVFAEVEWTTAALKQLAAKEYRYLSPVAVVRKRDRKLVALHSVALTNKPAIVGAEPIVNRADTPNDVADAPVDDVGDDDDFGVGIADDALAVLRTQLSLDALCDAETVLVAASRRLHEFERRRVLDAAEEKVNAAIRAGRVTEAQRGFALQLALRDASLFDEWLATAPTVVPLGRTQPPTNGAGRAAHHAVAASARAEFRAHPELECLTSEAAFVADALRARGLKGSAKDHSTRG